MNKKQFIVIAGIVIIITFILLFPPKALVRGGKTIMRFMPFETRKFVGRGIEVQTSYWDPNLVYDHRRIVPLIASSLIVGGFLIYILRDKKK